MYQIETALCISHTGLLTSGNLALLKFHRIPAISDCLFLFFPSRPPVDRRAGPIPGLLPVLLGLLNRTAGDDHQLLPLEFVFAPFQNLAFDQAIDHEPRAAKLRGSATGGGAIPSVYVESKHNTNICQFSIFRVHQARSGIPRWPIGRDCAMLLPS